MKVRCVRMEMDSSQKRFVFFFVMASDESDYQMSGEIKMVSEKREMYSVGETYELYLK